MIYFDNAATTPMDTNTVMHMCNYMMQNYGNPSTRYKIGRDAKDQIDQAKRELGMLINASRPEERIIFTSGGSEANTMVIREASPSYREKNVIYVYSNIEHESVIAEFKCGGHAWNSDTPSYPVKPSVDGTIKYGSLKNMLEIAEDVANRMDATILVSIMYVNNETGAINDVAELCELAHEYGALFHVDCVQALGTVPIDVEAIKCDFATFSAHKIHGPKGVGALYMRDTHCISNLINGTQEGGKRGGTENVAGIVGFSYACYRLRIGWNESHNRISDVRDTFIRELTSQLRGIEKFYLNVEPNEFSKILSIRFDNVDAETLMALLGEEVIVSAGSACHSAVQKPSRVLTEMGLSDEEAYRTIRVSFSRMNTVEEAVEGARIIRQKVEMIKMMQRLNRI